MPEPREKLKIGQITQPRKTPGPTLASRLIDLIAPGMEKTEFGGRRFPAKRLPGAVKSIAEFLRGAPADAVNMRGGITIYNPDVPKDVFAHEDVHDVLRNLDNLSDIVRPPEALINELRKKFEDPFNEEGLMSKIINPIFPKDAQNRTADEALAYALTDPDVSAETFVDQSLADLARRGIDISGLSKIRSRRQKSK